MAGFSTKIFIQALRSICFTFIVLLHIPVTGYADTGLSDFRRQTGGLDYSHADIAGVRRIVQSIQETSDSVKLDVTGDGVQESDFEWGYYVVGRDWESSNPGESWFATHGFGEVDHDYRPERWGERIDYYLIGGTGVVQRLTYTRWAEGTGLSVDVYYIMTVEDRGDYFEPIGSPVFRWVRLFSADELVAEGRIWLGYTQAEGQPWFVADTQRELRRDLRVARDQDEEYFAQLRALLSTDWFGFFRSGY